MEEFKGLLSVFLSSVFVFSFISFVFIQIGWGIIALVVFAFVFSWAFPTAINYLSKKEQK